MRKLLAVLVVMVLTAGDADAQARRDSIPPNNAPTYNTASYCEQVSQAVGGSYTIRNTCMDQERKARSAVRRWGIVEKRIRDYCAQVGQVVGGSYSIYQTCVRQERQARDG